MKVFLVMSILFTSLTSFAELVSQNMVYGNGAYEGYLVSPKTTKPNTPALLIIHNWMGVSDETKFQANRFADLGYIVFAADIYGKGIRPKDPKEAGTLATKYKTDRKLFRDRLNLALNTLKDQKNVDKKKVAVAGYCFGGTGAVELARSGADLKGVISFHGGLDSPTPADGKNIKAQLLIHHGAVDPFVKPEDLTAFEKELKDNKVSYKLIKYDGAVHSFTEKGAGSDVSKGAAYNETADLKSFDTSKDFLKKIF